MSRKRVSAWRRAKHRVAHSIKLRMVLLFLLLAAAMTFVFFTGAQRAFTMGWRDAARPLLMDYVDQLTRECTAGGPTPSIERAQAIIGRLPLTVSITGPQVNWSSHPDQSPPDWLREKPGAGSSLRDRDADNGPDWQGILQRTTADGHVLTFGINGQAFERKPRMIGFALAALLVLTLLAWMYVRHLLKPLDAIGEGARRFGKGDFSQPIPERCIHGPDELGELATTINTMGQDIHQMLEAKRALLLAISHELRSPLTRARLNAELLPETADVNPQRDALLRDLQEMASLISDLLESERLAGNHTALQRASTDLPALAWQVIDELRTRHPAAEKVTVQAPENMPVAMVDASRVRLMLRNLVDNALRHGADAANPPSVTLSSENGTVTLEVRDHGPGVPDEQLAHLAQAFYRPDSARTRAAGGVGLGLHLCRLVAQAHGGSFAVRNAQPGLAVTVTLPPA